MPRTRSRLAKLTRPRLRGVISRERLFAAMDAARERCVVWVVGPPGAGKTTLVAGYLHARAVPGIWYHADAGDADVATFFHYLRQALHTSGARPPPLLSPQYLPDLDGFSRRFFRQLFQRMPEHAVLVLDNWQEVSATAALARAVAHAVEEVPHGSNLIVVSREAPPPELARNVANGQVATLGWLQLRLTREETEAILACRGVLDNRAVDKVHERANGWAAGVTLLLEDAECLAGVSAGSAPAAENTFAYFAAQILDKADAALRSVLVHASFFPWFTAEWVAEVSGVVDAARKLDQLHRRNLFVERRTGQQNTYMLHALFRTFLLHCARQEFDDQRVASLSEAAGECMYSFGHFEEAFELFCEARVWPRAARLLVEAAPNLIAHGRLRTVQEWVARIAHEVAENDPWMSYWLACATAPIDPEAACPLFERAYEAGRTAGDADGQMASAAGMLDAIFMQYGDFTRMDRWIDILWAFVRDRELWLSPDFALRVQSALLVSTCFRMPGHPAVRPSACNVVRLLGKCDDVNLKVWAAIRLCSYVNMTADFELAFAALVDAGTLIDHPELVPPIAAEFSHVLGYTHYLRGDSEAALSWYARALQIVESEGLARMKRLILSMRAACERRAGDVGAAVRTLAELESAPNPQAGAISGLYRIVRALTLASQGSTAAAVEEGVASQRSIEACGATGLRALNCLHNVDILLAAGEREAADARLEEARALVAGTSMDALRATIALNQAYLAHMRGEADVRTVCLTEALESLRGAAGRVRARWYGEAMSRLFPIALRDGIEPALVRTLIREMGVKPAVDVEEEWPWPVRIRTLGHFELIRDDIPVRFEHKTPKKPIAVLKALIAHGQAGMPVSLLCDQLWPDLEGDAAREAFRTALHRLRRLLGSPERVGIEDGIVALDHTAIWIDVAAFERALRDPAGLERVLDLYRGEFLQDEREAAWPVVLREKLRWQFVGRLADAALARECSGDTESAIALFQRGVQADPLAEAFHQGLIRCYVRQGRQADAMAAYGRCRQFLLGGLGVSPSAATVSLVQSIGASRA